MNNPGKEGNPASAAGEIALAGKLVPRLGLGAMRLRGAPSDVELFLLAIDLGVRVIDTAAFYYEANPTIAAALYPYRDDLVIATKAGPRGTSSGIVAEDGPDGIIRSVEENLRTLRVERLDLVHARKMPGLSFPMLLDTLVALKDRGLIAHIGVSNVTLDEVRFAAALTSVASVQNPYSVFRGGDDEVLDWAERHKVPYMPFFPLGGGSPANSRAFADSGREISPASYGIRWLLNRSPVMLPIPGTGSLQHLRENVAAAAASGPAATG